jgi:hypothetical protein
VPADPESLIYSIQREVDRLEAKVSTHITLSDADFSRLKEDVAELKGIALTHVTIDRYRPVERVVYGLIGLVLIAVVTSLVALVVRNPGG